MNPVLAQALASAVIRMFQGGMISNYRRPQAAQPLDATAEAHGLTDMNPEFMMSEDEHGIGMTNRGRTLLPADAAMFLRGERGPLDWERRQENVALETPRTRDWEARMEPMAGPGVIANAPGEPDMPIAGDLSWALHRLKQADAADLIPEVPTPADRDLPAAWRDTSARLAKRARRKGFDLTARLQGRPDPRAAQALSAALKGLW